MCIDEQYIQRIKYILNLFDRLMQAVVSERDEQYVLTLIVSALSSFNRENLIVFSLLYISYYARYMYCIMYSIL